MAAGVAASPETTHRGAGRMSKGYYFRELARYLRFLVPASRSILEIGCRDGDLLAALKPTRGVGLDFSAELVEVARRRHPDLTFQLLGGGSFPADGTFDVIIVRHVLEFMEDVQGAIEDLRRLCHRGTRLIIINRNYLWFPVLRIIDRLARRPRRAACAWLSLNDLEHLFRFADFEMIVKGYRTPVPVWIPGVSWIANRILGKLPGLWKLGIDQWVIARPLGIPIQSEPSVSVVIPCRNERGTVLSVVQRTTAMGGHTELIFVEGHSRDGTLEELQRIQSLVRDRDIKVYVQKGEGKGDAVREGVETAKGDIVLILDADLSVDPEVLPRFVDALVRGDCELALGCRLVYPLPSQAMQTINTLGNKFFGRAFSFILGQRVKDTLCGTKAIWREDYERILQQRRFFGTIDPFGDFDLIFGAARLSLKIREIPVHYHERVYGQTNIRRWRHGLLLLRMLITGFLRLKLE